MTGNFPKLHTFSSNESYECVELEMREPAPPRSKRSRKWILGITIAAIFMLGAGIGTIVVAFSKSKQSPSAVEPGLSSVSGKCLVFQLLNLSLSLSLSDLIL